MLLTVILIQYKTPSSLASFKSRLVLPFWYWLTQDVPEKRPLNGFSSSSSFEMVPQSDSRAFTQQDALYSNHTAWLSRHTQPVIKIFSTSCICIDSSSSHSSSQSYSLAQQTHSDCDNDIQHIMHMHSQLTQQHVSACLDPLTSESDNSPATNQRQPDTITNQSATALPLIYACNMCCCVMSFEHGSMPFGL